MRQVTAIASLAVATAVIPVDAAVFYNVGTVDVASTSDPANPQFIGSNPAGVAWDGTDLYLAGFNASATDTANTGVVKVSDALTAPTFGTAFGLVSTAPNRGYIGLDVRGTGATADLAATYDGGASPGIDRLFMYNADGTRRWEADPAVRPPTGPAFDEMVNRVSYLYQGSALVRNHNITDGTSTGTANTNGGVFADNLNRYRDLDFNATTGDAWLRLENNVVKASRTGSSTYATTPLLAVDLTDVNSVGQSIQYLAGIDGDDFAIYNDRGTTANGQAFTAVVGGVRDDGTAEPLTFLTADGSAAFSADAGSAYYDFSWNAATRTLAIADFTNHQVYIFATAPVPEPTTLSFAAVAGVALLGRRRRRR